MRDSNSLESVPATTERPVLSGGHSARGLLPFSLIGPIAAVSDLIIILGTSIATGIAYHLAAFQSTGPVQSFTSIGALIYIDFLAILTARGTYKPQNLASFSKQVREVAVVWLLVFLLLSLLAFSLKVGEEYSRGATITFFTIGLVAIIGERFFIARFIANALKHGAFAEQKIILLVEEGQLSGSDVVENLKSCGYVSAKTFEFAAHSISSLNDTSWLFAMIEEIIEISRHDKIDSVFLLVSWDDRHSIEQLMDFLRVLSIPIFLLPDRNVAHFLRSRFVNIGTVWTAELKRAPLTLFEQFCKRTIDIVLATGALVILSPTMLLAAIFIKIDSRGPIFFAQTRNGFNGRPFRMFKFRTMSVLEDGPTIRQATKDDPRVTRFGRVLRRTNIDELPQLFNVLAGDMSLIGPRPHAAAHNSEYEKIIANYAYRYHVKPGVTGWAQVNGLRGETQTVDMMAKRVEYDLWYINNWTFWLDIKIIFRTLILGLQPSAY